MSNGNGHRWSKFWWCDWQNDKGLQQCSLAARGLWIELLGLCHASKKPGYLLINGTSPDVTELADVLGKTTGKEVAALLAELERRRIFSRDEHGVIFSRRMVKDAAVSEQASKWGKRGGNPALNPQGGLTPPLNPKEGNGVNPSPYPPPLNQKLEAEEEAEPSRGPPTVAGGRRADGENPRALGTNPRAIGDNPRKTGTNPRRFRNAAHDIAREMDAQQPLTIDATLSPQVVDFLEFTGARPKQAGGANG